MTIRLSLALAISLGLFCFAHPAQATITWTGDVDPNDPNTWDEYTWSYIGKTSDGTLTVDGDSDLLSRYGYIGYDPNSTGEVTVDGTGTTWTNNTHLYVGHEGDGTLAIVGGGTVNTSYSTWVAKESGSSGEIHFADGTLTTRELLAASNNITGTGTLNTRALVSDVDLTFDATHGLNQTFTINDMGQDITVNLDVDGSGIMGAGYGGTGTISISDGMVIESPLGYIGYKAGSTGTVIIQGAGSSWINRSNLYVGNEGNGTLTVTDSGILSNDYCSIGHSSGSTGEVTIDGFGSTWTNDSSFRVGYEGDGILNITGGGTVISNRYGGIGIGPDSTGQATVDGVGSIWVNKYDLNVSYEGNGTLNITGGGAVSNDYGYIAREYGSTGEVMVDGVGSTWTNNGFLFVGREGDGTLAITGGGTVSNNNGSIGFSSGSTGEVIVDGVGSTWTNNGSLGVGEYGNSNGTLCITGGGAVSNDDGYIANSFDTTGEVTVQGANSTWINNNDLYIGQFGNGTLNIADSGTVTVAGNTWLSFSSGSSGIIHFDIGILTTSGLLGAVENLRGTGTINTCGLVSDVDLVFDAFHRVNQTFSIHDNPGQNISVHLDIDGSGAMGAGYSNVGTLRIADGIVIESTSGYIGYNSDSTGEVTIGGTSSTWINSGDLYVGRYGNGTLAITSGGAVSNEDAYIANYPNSTGEVTVNGTDSAWINNGNVNVGRNGDGKLAITGGGIVSNDAACIGCNFNSMGEVTIVGSGSTWINNGGLAVGSQGHGTLTIKEGGNVSINGGGIGSLPYSTGKVTINGNGSMWSNSGHVYVGDKGNGTLAISSGGIVSNHDGYTGHESGSTGKVTVNGFGSTWINDGYLYVGHLGNGTLTITHGGAVSNSDYGYIGYGTNSTSQVIVDGIGSTWTQNDNLYVGRSGKGTLTITDGGQVSDDRVYIGFLSDSTGDVTVDGIGSMWTNSDCLTVGYKGEGTLTITNGGLVSVDGILSISPYGYSGNDFICMATGGMLALNRDAEGSIYQFLGIVDGTDAIQYWNTNLTAWTNITSATYGDDYTLEYLSTGDLAGYTVLTVLTPEPGGDFDFDGDVDGADLLAWQRGESPMPSSEYDLDAWKECFGTSTSGDYDADGDVDGADFLAWQRGESPDPLSSTDLAIWRQHFLGVTNGPATAAVPEPGAIGLWIVALFAAGFTRNCRLGQA